MKTTIQKWIAIWVAVLFVGTSLNINVSYAEEDTTIQDSGTLVQVQTLEEALNETREPEAPRETPSFFESNPLSQASSDDDSDIPADAIRTKSNSDYYYRTVNLSGDRYQVFKSDGTQVATLIKSQSAQGSGVTAFGAPDVSRDGKYIALAQKAHSTYTGHRYENSYIHVVSAETGEEVNRIQLESVVDSNVREISGVEFSDASSSVVKLTYADGETEHYSVETGERVSEIPEGWTAVQSSQKYAYRTQAVVEAAESKNILEVLNAETGDIQKIAEHSSSNHEFVNMDIFDEGYIFYSNFKRGESTRQDIVQSLTDSSDILLNRSVPNSDSFAHYKYQDGKLVLNDQVNGYARNEVYEIDMDAKTTRQWTRAESAHSYAQFRDVQHYKYAGASSYAYRLNTTSVDGRNFSQSLEVMNLETLEVVTVLSDLSNTLQTIHHIEIFAEGYVYVAWGSRSGPGAIHQLYDLNNPENPVMEMQGDLAVKSIVYEYGAAKIELEATSSSNLGAEYVGVNKIDLTRLISPELVRIDEHNSRYAYTLDSATNAPSQIIDLKTGEKINLPSSSVHSTQIVQQSTLEDSLLKIEFNKIADVWRLTTVEERSLAGNLKSSTQLYYHANGQVHIKDAQNYFDSGAVKSKNYEVFYANGNRLYVERYEKQANGMYVYHFTEGYHANGQVHTRSDNTYHENGTIKTRDYEVFYDTGNPIYIERYEVRANGSYVSSLNQYFHANGQVYIEDEKSYDINGAVAASIYSVFGLDGTLLYSL